MSYTPHPEHMRAPQNLSDASLREALDELDAKIKILHNRAHATRADSSATYNEHAAALETKRAKLLAQLGPAPTEGAPTPARSTWEEIWHGIENLRNDLRDIV